MPLNPPSGGSVDGTAINPLSIGATTPTTLIKVDEIRLNSGFHLKTDGSQIYFYEPGNARNTTSIASAISLANDIAVSWAAGNSATGTLDLSLWRGGAGILQIRNGANAQEIQVFGTYTSSTVYERLSSKYDSGSGAFVIGTEKGASGGSARNLNFVRDGTIVAYLSNAGFNAGTVNALNYLVISTTAYMQSASAGCISLFDNATGTDFKRLQFGGTGATRPAIKQVDATLDFVLANDSGFCATQSIYSRFGSGSPESVVTAPVGAVYHRTDGGAGTSFYVKESGTGNTGWVAK